jgi:hypothetical protein
VRLPPRIDTVEKFGERDGAITSIIGGGSIFLVRAQIWRGSVVATRSYWVSGEQWVKEGKEAVPRAIHLFSGGFFEARRTVFELVVRKVERAYPSSRDRFPRGSRARFFFLLFLRQAAGSRV